MVSFKLSALFVGLLAVVQASVPSERRDGCSLDDINGCIAAVLPMIPDFSDEVTFLMCMGEVDILDPVPGLADCLSDLCISTDDLPDECDPCTSEITACT
ncbi:hypothetical protein M422DRAFT_272113 [Sphaerobolus stellatus SS14]|uniref:Hydrophobin n=1 Tax=Sphaerobolus stellatus (strain SS14) TaxID=990650 RepID=A0A0C9UCA8_SPHS4|nr:hypothetical protein M422DRAFT_272113 [Sphaerobolus stellatus SS14]